MNDEFEPKATIEEIDENEKNMRRLSPLFIIQGVLSLLAGLILLFRPTAGLAFASVVLGIFLTAEGVGRLIGVLRLPRIDGRTDFFSIAGSLLRIIFGVLIIFHPIGAGKAGVAVIFIFAGINLIAGSVFSFRKEPGLRESPYAAASVIGTFLIGLILLLMPVLSGLLFIRILGCVLVLGSVSPLAMGLRNRY